MSEDGLCVAALRVAQLRLARLLRGSPPAEDWLARDAPAFTRAFRRYHAEVPPTAFFPAGEARLWDAFRAAHEKKERGRPRGRAPLRLV